METNLKEIESRPRVEPINIAKYGFTILQVETKSTCNMKCEFCPYPIRDDKGDELSEEEFRDIIDSIVPDKSFEYVVLSQFNEPLMDKRIFDFIKYVKSKNLKVLLVTNSLLFKSKEKIKLLVEAEPDIVKISLHTINDKMFKFARGVNSSFENYKQWIFDYLNEAAGTNTLVNVDVACNFLSGWRGIRTSLFGLDRGDPSVYNTISHLRKDLKSFLEGWAQKYDKYQFDEQQYDKFLNDLAVNYVNQSGFPIADNIDVKVKKFKYGRAIRDFQPISISAGCGSREVGVLASGRVVPCCLTYGKNLDLGNIKKTSLAEALRQNNELLVRIRTGDNFPATCSKCLGAPTKRGAFFKSVRNQMIRWKNSAKKKG